MLSKNTFFPAARQIGTTENEEWRVTPLIEVAQRGWVETGKLDGNISFDKNRDFAGPVNIATALERTVGDRNQRVVVVGTGEFLANAYLGNLGNLDLGVNIMNWLTGDDRMITIQPRPAPDSNLDIEPFTFYLHCVHVPAGAAAGVHDHRRGDLVAPAQVNVHEQGVVSERAARRRRSRARALVYLKPGTQQAPTEHVLATGKAEQASSIRIERAGTAPIVLEKKHDGWFMTAPFAARADASRVQRLLAITEARSAHRLAATDLARFELERPEARLDGGRPALRLRHGESRVPRAVRARPAMPSTRSACVTARSSRPGPRT